MLLIVHLSLQMRLGVGGEGDSLHEKPRIRESAAKAWWGEMVWNPSTFQHPSCQDVSKTSDSHPGTATVRLRASMPSVCAGLADWSMCCRRPLHH